MTNRTRTIVFIIVGIVFLALAVFATIMLLNRFKQSTQQAQEQVQPARGEVVILARDMKLGDRLEEADLTVSRVPVDVIPRNAVTLVADAAGKFLKTDMIQGEMLLLHNLAQPTNNNGDLSYILDPEHVLMAFPATDLLSRENVVQRGDIIDILATFDEEVKQVNDTGAIEANALQEEEGPVMRTFTVDAFQKISVTALVLDVVSQEQTSTANNNQPAPTVTSISSYLLALSPQDALIIKHLKDVGAVFDVVIRAPTAAARYDLTPVTAEYIIELYGLEILP